LFALGLNLSSKCDFKPLVNETELHERLDRMEANSLQQYAEIMALREFISVRLEGAHGLNATAAFEEIDARKRTAHAILLRGLENTNPGLAARLDKRRGLPEE